MQVVEFLVWKVFPVVEALLIGVIVVLLWRERQDKRRRERGALKRAAEEAVKRELLRPRTLACQSEAARKEWASRLVDAWERLKIGAVTIPEDPERLRKIERDVKREMGEE